MTKSEYLRSIEECIALKEQMYSRTRADLERTCEENARLSEELSKSLTGLTMHCEDYVERRKFIARCQRGIASNCKMLQVYVKLCVDIAKELDELDSIAWELKMYCDEPKRPATKRAKVSDDCELND